MIYQHFLFPSLFGKRENKSKKNSAAQETRKLQIESLESRDLLSISSADFSAIRAAYLDLNLSADINNYNLIEITANELSEEKLRTAIDTAKGTTKDDLIVLRTSATQNRITLSGTELTINANASQYGTISIVSLGEERLTINANGESRHFLINNQSNVSFAGVTFTDGYVFQQSGGAILSQHSTLRFVETTFSENVSEGTEWWIAGGAIRAEGAGSNLFVSDSLFQNNTTQFSGGAISASETDTTIFGTNFVGNQCGGYGGGLYVYHGSLSVEKTEFIKNDALSDSNGHGGGLWSENNVTQINDLIFNGNKAKWGGGFRVQNTTLTASNLVFYDNWAQHDGGGANFNSSEVTFFNASFWNNYSGLYGGGIFCENTTGTFSNITAGNNVSDHDGGGFFTRGTSNLTLINTTLSSNTARWGGGLYIRGDSAVTLYNNIIAGNTNKDVASDLFQYQTTKNLAGSNNIVGIGKDVIGLTNGVNSNRIGTETAPIDAMVGPMTDLGNGVPVMPILSQSPAIDAGVSRSGVSSLDAAGQSRYDYPETTNTGTGTPNYIDIGSYEYQGKSETGTVVDELEQPLTPKGLATDSKDRVIATDYLNNRLIVYSSIGTELFTIGHWGDGDGQLYRPIDVTVDKNDNIYVVSGNNTVQVFDSTGKFLHSFGGYGNSVGKFNNPEGIGYDAATNCIYVADTGNQRVQCFTINGQLVTTFGNGGVIGTTGMLKRDHTGFDCPTDVAVHPINGNVYIADRINSRLEVYDANGNYVRSFLSVYRPEALCFDERGNLFIAGEDTGGQPAKSGRIRVLRNGQELCDSNFFGGFDDLGKLTSGIALRQNGDVIFSDTLNSRLVQTKVTKSNPTSEEFTYQEYITDFDIENRGTYVVFRWKTTQPSPTFLKYAPAGNSLLFQEYEDNTLKTVHEVKIDNLTEKTLLDYQIGYKNSFGNLTKWSQTDRINTGVPQGQKLIQRVKTIGLIYMDRKLGSEYEKFSEDEARELEERFYRIAKFYWQNSGFNLWLDFTIVRVERNVTETDHLGLGIADQELRALGFTEADEIDLVLGAGEVFEGNYGGGVITILGKEMATAHWSAAIDGMGIHEVNHALDSYYGYFNSLDKYESCHSLWGVQGGEGRSLNGQIVKNLLQANYPILNLGDGKYVSVPDADDDRIPDDSVTGLTRPLPITEKALGTSPQRKDTDGDGMSDYDEATFFSVDALNPLSKDTDNDGIADSEDLNPAYPINDHVQKNTPDMDGVIDFNEGWTLVVDNYSYDNSSSMLWDNNEGAKETKTYMSWDDDYFYIAFENFGWSGFEFFLDGGNDNWYYGTDAYKLSWNMWDEKPNVSTMVGSPDVFQMIDNGNDWSEFYDTESQFTKPYCGQPFFDKDNEGLGFPQRLVTENDLMFIKEDLGGWYGETYVWLYNYAVAIPWSPNVTRLDGYDGKILGLDISIHGDKLFNTDHYAHIMLVDPNKTTLNLETDVNTIDEGTQDGVTFTVTRTGNVSKALELTVTSSNPAELAVPQSVVIPAGESSVTFKASGVLDGKRDGNKNVTVTVGMKNTVSNSVVITVLDVDLDIDLDVPTGFAVKEKTSNSVTLQWDDHPDATQYELQYRQKGVLSWSIGPSGAFSGMSNLWNATVTSLKSSTDYEFRLRAKDIFGESDWTNILTAKTDQELTPPAVPSGFGVKEKTSNSITLQWNNDADATQYELQYRRKGVLTWTAAPSGTLASNQWTASVSGLAPSTEYEFRLRAKNAVGESDWTNTLTVLTDNESLPPAVPSGFGVNEKTSNSITLQWISGADANEYELQYRRKGVLPWTVGPTGAMASGWWQATVSSLASSTEYEFRLRAENDYGQSGWTNILTAVTETASSRPQAVITCGQNRVQTGCSLFLSGADSYDTTDEPLEYLWDTDGDGIYETTQKAFWFSTEDIAPGRRHTVSLIVKNSNEIVSEPSEFTFQVDHVAPTFQIKEPLADELMAGENTYWEFFAESSKFSSIVHWSIDWGDHSMKTEISGGPRNEVRVSHRFSTAGESNIMISTTDINGNISTIVLDAYLTEKVQTVEEISVQKIFSDLSESNPRTLPTVDIFEMVASRQIENDIQTAIETVDSQVMIPQYDEILVPPQNFDFDLNLSETMWLRQMLDLDQLRTLSRKSDTSIFQERVWEDELFDEESLDFVQQERNIDFWNGMFEDELVKSDID